MTRRRVVYTISTTRAERGKSKRDDVDERREILRCGTFREEEGSVDSRVCVTMLTVLGTGKLASCYCIPDGTKTTTTMTTTTAGHVRARCQSRSTRRGTGASRPHQGQTRHRKTSRTPNPRRSRPLPNRRRSGRSAWGAAGAREASARTCGTRAGGATRAVGGAA